MKWSYKENVANPSSKEETRGLWDVYENENGQSSLKIHTPKLVWQSCPTHRSHYYELTNSPRRECTCTKCGFMTTFIVGLQSLVDGKIVSIR